MLSWMPLLCRVPRAPCNGTSTPSMVVTLALDHSTLQWHPPIAPRPLPQSWPSPPFPHHSTQQWHPAMAPRPLPQSWPSPSSSPTIPHNNGTLQWHHVHSPKVGCHPPLPPPYHTTMAPCNGTTSTPPKLAVTLLFPHHTTQQWHPAMAPRPLPPKLAVTLPFPHHTTLQWHPAMAPRPLPQSWPSPSSSPTIPHNNGTLQWHHVHSPKVGCHPPLPPPYHTTMAPYDATQQWHLVHCTLQWHPGTTSNPPKRFVALPFYWK